MRTVFSQIYIIRSEFWTSGVGYYLFILQAVTTFWLCCDELLSIFFRIEVNFLSNFCTDLNSSSDASGSVRKSRALRILASSMICCSRQEDLFSCPTPISCQAERQNKDFLSTCSLKYLTSRTCKSVECKQPIT